MAQVTGELQGLSGKVGGLTFYSKGGKTFARKATSNASRDMNAPNMVRVKENLQEFSNAASWGKAIRIPFSGNTRGAIAGTLTALILATAKRYDIKNIRGARTFINADAGYGEVVGFEFNPTTSLSQVLLGSNLEVNLPGLTDVTFSLNDCYLNAPAGATHFNIVYAIAEVDAGTLTTKQYSNKGLMFPTPEALPATGQIAANATTVSYPTSPVEGNLLLAVASVMFYQEVNGEFYKLNEGLKNPSRLVLVQKA